MFKLHIPEETFEICKINFCTFKYLVGMKYHKTQDVSFTTPLGVLTVFSVFFHLLFCTGSSLFWFVCRNSSLFFTSQLHCHIFFRYTLLSAHFYSSPITPFSFKTSLYFEILFKIYLCVCFIPDSNKFLNQRLYLLDLILQVQCHWDMTIRGIVLINKCQVKIRMVITKEWP